MPSYGIVCLFLSILVLFTQIRLYIREVRRECTENDVNKTDDKGLLWLLLLLWMVFFSLSFDLKLVLNARNGHPKTNKPIRRWKNKWALDLNVR